MRQRSGMGTSLFGIQKVVTLASVVVSIDGIDVRRIGTRFGVLRSRGFNLVFHTATDVLDTYQPAELSPPTAVGSTGSCYEVNAPTF